MNLLKKVISKVKSKDGVEYTLNTFKDVITLTDGQISQIEEKIKKLQSLDVESSKGVSIVNVPDEQNTEVIRLIAGILKEFDSIEEIVLSSVIDTTAHAQKDRLDDVEICFDRMWDQENIDYEIAEAIKRSYRVEQIRVRFDPQTKESWPRFGFTIRGFKGGKGVYDDTKLVIHFDKDPLETSETIMVITILKPHT